MAEVGLVSVILPTTGRPDRAEQALYSCLATAGEHRLEVIVVVDADWETYSRVYALLESWKDGHPGFEFVVDHSVNYRGNVKAWNDGLAESHGETIVFAADDLRFQDGWLDEALRVMATLPEGGGLVGFNDGHLDGAVLSTHYLLSRRFIIDHLGGRIAWDWYAHSFNDLETNERAKRVGRHAWAENAWVTHDHWTFGTRPKDATDERWIGEWAAAHDAYERRKAAGFPDVLPAVITD